MAMLDFLAAFNMADREERERVPAELKQRRASFFPDGNHTDFYAMYRETVSNILVPAASTFAMSLVEYLGTNEMPYLPLAVSMLTTTGSYILEKLGHIDPDPKSSVEETLVDRSLADALGALAASGIIKYAGSSSPSCALPTTVKGAFETYLQFLWMDCTGRVALSYAELLGRGFYNWITQNLQKEEERQQ